MDLSVSPRRPSTAPLAGRRVLVTGAAGGLGLAIVKHLTADGATVAMSDRSTAQLHAQATALEEAGAAVRALPADLASAAGTLPEAAEAAMGGLDGLVNAAGIMQTKPFTQVNVSDWEQMLAINLTASFQLLQGAGVVMARGAIVNIASVAARSARANAAHYAASKSGLLSLTKSAAVALAPRIRVNAVCPGVFRTQMWEDIIRERDESFGPGAGESYFDEVCRVAPLGRAGKPEELAAVVSFLISDAASFITGQAINVCGGLEMN